MDLGGEGAPKTSSRGIFEVSLLDAIWVASGSIFGSDFRNVVLMLFWLLIFLCVDVSGCFCLAFTCSVGVLSYSFPSSYLFLSRELSTSSMFFCYFHSIPFHWHLFWNQQLTRTHYGNHVLFLERFVLELQSAHFPISQQLLHKNELERLFSSKHFSGMFFELISIMLTQCVNHVASFWNRTSFRIASWKSRRSQKALRIGFWTSV